MPKILIFRLNIKSFGDLAQDAIFVGQLPKSFWVMPVYPPLITMGGRENVANKAFVGVVARDIHRSFATPLMVSKFLNFGFQILYCCAYGVKFLSHRCGLNLQFCQKFIKALFGRKVLFTELKSRGELSPVPSVRESLSVSTWWTDHELSCALADDLALSEGRLVVIHHRPESNGGMLHSHASSLEQSIKKLLADGFCVVRLKEPQHESLGCLGSARYHELVARQQNARSQITLIRNCSFFIGGSSGPIWVALYFGRPTLQLNYTDFLLNGPYLNCHFVAPMKMKIKSTGASLTCLSLLERGVDGHIFGRQVGDDIHFVPLSGDDVMCVVDCFRERISERALSSNVRIAEEVIVETRQKYALAITPSQLESRHGACAEWSVEVMRINITAKSPSMSFIFPEQT
jgi:putative glycosyltransferase (TIGR04372 family)